MVAKILEKPSRVFAGVGYNSDKIDRRTAELMRIANFGALQGLNSPRPQDLVNYLKMISRNSGIKNTQLHAVISANGRNYNKNELTAAAELWLREMGYGAQPYLIVFHKDTDNNHVHIVSSRVGKNGKKIDRDFENARSLSSINKLLGYTDAMRYNFSTKAQFYLILEKAGALGRDYIHEEKMQKKLGGYRPDKVRAAELKEMFTALRSSPGFFETLREAHSIDVSLHSSEGKTPYGYTVIDHHHKHVFKGSEILSLKYLLDPVITYTQPGALAGGSANFATKTPVYDGAEIPAEPIYIRPVWIAPDVDDEAVLGRNRRRKKKARTNTR